MSTMTSQVVLQIKDCPVCGIRYAAPEVMFERIDTRGGAWFCPNGHRLVFIETELERTIKERDRAQRQLATTRESEKFYREQTHKTQRQLAATKGVVTRTKRRIANGVCPCCKRTFANVAKHMAGQHPAWLEEERKAKSEIAR